MSNLFQDVNGTTPVTADGQPVGLVLDKSRDGALGSELVVNGTFDTDISGWTLIEGSASVVNGVLEITNTSGVWTIQIAQAFQTVVGKTYTVTYYVPETSAASYVYCNASRHIGQKGNLSFTFTATNTSTTFVYKTNTNVVGSVIRLDNVSVKEVLGTHASQPVATQRPTYNASPDRLTLDLVDDGLLVNIPTGGWDGYMVVGTDQGTASYGVSLPAGDYELGGDYFFGNTINQVLFREGAVEPAHLKAIEYVFIGDGAKESYADVTDFGSYWRDKGITEFPLIDTSSGLIFFSSWRNNNLTSFPLIDTSSGTNFSYTWLNNNLTSFPLLDTSNGINFQGAWQGNSLTSFPPLDTSSGTDFSLAWTANNLTSFPLIDTSSGTNFSYAWRNNNLTSFPLVDTSSGTDFSNAWYGNYLTSFPLLDTSSGTNFAFAWFNNSLTSFPLIDTSSGTNFSYAWRFNGNLTDFPANMFDNCLATNFIQAFGGTNLSQSSIDGILISIESNGTSNGTFGQSGGSAPSSVGEAAITAMRSRGWTITVTGGY